MQQWDRSRTTQWVCAGLITVVAGLAIVGCGASDSPGPVTDDKDDNAYSTLVDELQIEVGEGASGSPAEREFRLVPEELAAASGLTFVWQIGDSFGFKGLHQSYVFGSSGTYRVRVEAFAGDEQPVLAMETEVVVEFAVNVAPTAVANAPAEVEGGQIVYLDGQGSSDPDSTALVWEWTQTGGPDVTLQQADEPKAFFSAPQVTEPTELAFTLTVYDEKSASSATVRVLVLPADDDKVPVDPAETDDEPTDEAPGDDDVNTTGVDDGDDSTGGGGGTGGLGGGTTLPPFEYGTLVDDRPIDWANFTLPPRALAVRTEAELRSAGWASYNRDVTVLVLNDMTVNAQIYFPNSSNIAHVLGIGGQRSLNFTMRFNGNWADTTANYQNGIGITTRQSLLRNLRLTGLQVSGAAVKSDPHQELLSVSHCTFEHVGDEWFTPRVIPATTTSDVVYTQCVAVHGMAGHVDVRRNTFRDASTNQTPWGHVLYISGRTTSALDNLFERTGNPFGLGFYVAESSVQAFGNTVRDVQLSMGKSGDPTPTVLGSLGTGDYSVYMYNSCSGQVELSWRGSTGTQRNYFGGNTYNGLTHGTWFAADMDDAFTRPEWEQRGFDGDPEIALPPSAVLVHDEAELRAAAARTATEHLVILVANSMVINDTVTFPASNRYVRLVGYGTMPTLTFNMAFHGDWSSEAERTRPGLDFNGKRVFIRNLAFSGYQLGGAAVRAGVSETLEVSQCEFRNLGTQNFPSRVNPPVVATDTIATRALAVGAVLPQTVIITGTRFVNCSTNQADFGSVLDLGGRTVLVADNIFESCGNALSFPTSPAGAGIHVLGNSFSRPALTASASGMQVMPFLCRPAQGVAFTFAQNTVSGIYRNAWQGLPDLNWFLAVDNTYTSAFYEENWAVEPGGAGTLSWTDWRALGLD